MKLRLFTYPPKFDHKIRFRISVRAALNASLAPDHNLPFVHTIHLIGRTPTLVALSGESIPSPFGPLPFFLQRLWADAGFSYGGLGPLKSHVSGIGAPGQNGPGNDCPI
jgi:hypothetical protein